MFLPYSTDAPVYHWPYATVGLIVVNVLLWLAVPLEQLIEPGNVWILSYGDGIHPDQWFGSRFMHGGFFHLLGNMMFLWVFGLVVEGKLGALAFLACYFLIGIGQAAIEQVCMLGYDGMVPGSLGASAAIYGIMVMAIIWAPDNDISFFFWFVVTGTAEATVLMFGGTFVLLDIGFALMLGGYAGSSVLHVMGAMLGLPIGITMLRSGWVDCEGWDLFTRYGNAKKKDKEQEAKQAEEAQRDAAESAERDIATLAAARAQFDEYLANNSASAALKLYEKLKHRGDGWNLDTQRLKSLVRGLYAEKRWPEVAPFMAALIEADPKHADATRVSLAQLCVRKLDRPGRALELLDKVNSRSLNEKQRAVANDARRRADQLVAAGTIEFDDDDW